MTSKPIEELSERLQFALEIARAAGDLTLGYFRRLDLSVEDKVDRSPVTIADRAAEKLLRERIGRYYPQDGVIGEEFGTNKGSSGYEWVLDPIDGTKSFIHGVPLYTTLVAVLYEDQPKLGIIHAPATGETVFASRGSGCWYRSPDEPQPRPARVSSKERLGDGLLVTSELEGFCRHQRGDATDLFMRLQRAARVARTWGDGYGYLMVATGRAEVMIDPIMNLWDAAPLQTVIEEAGGQFFDWHGKPTIRAGEAIATNACLAEEVLSYTRTH